MDAKELDEARQSYHDFLAGRKTVTLGTIDARGNPFVAITPFVQVDDAMYVYVSEIAEHYEHLMRLPQVMVFLHADEAESRNLFAVERVRFNCAVRKVADEENEHVFEQLKADHNAALIDVLRGLDFSLFELTPIDGRYIVGFGKAFDVDLAGERFDHVVVDKEKTSERI